MRCRRFWSFVLLGIFSLPSFHANDETDVKYRFIAEDGENVLEYHHAQYGLLRIRTPTFMSSFSLPRIAEEIDIYINQGSRRRWSQRLTLEIFYYAVTYGKDFDPDAGTEKIDRIPKGLEGATNWLNESISICEWQGITCGDSQNQDEQIHALHHRIDTKLLQWHKHDWDGANDTTLTIGEIPTHAVTKIILSGKNLEGTLPSELFMLTQLSYLDLHANLLHGPIPTQFGMLSSLVQLDVTNNLLVGSIPWQLYHLSKNLQELWVGSNRLEGSINHYLTHLSNLRFLDVSHNRMAGKIPAGVGTIASLRGIFLDNNELTGTIITKIGALKNILFLHFNHNYLRGTIPSEVEHLTLLRTLHLHSNTLEGKLPTELFSLATLESLNLGHNSLIGTIPEGDDILKRGNRLDEFRWELMKKLTSLSLESNNFNGTIPASLFDGLRDTLIHLNIGFNRLIGTIPHYVARMSHLQTLEIPGNDLTGTLPMEMSLLSNIKQINLTANRFVGSIPWCLCEAKKTAILQASGCDAVLCPPGTFHPEGGATIVAGCRPCPPTPQGELMIPPISQLLGRTTCEDVIFKQGDLNADGVVSPREVLRLLFFHTDGRNWGELFQSWHDMDVHECDLKGITCVGREIARIDLSEAALCTNGLHKEGSPVQCPGLPGELGLLTSLEVLTLPRRQHLRGTIPTEFGLLTKLRFLDLSNCQRLSGTIPSELGKMTSLHVLNLSGSRFNSTIPSEIFQLIQLEKLHLSANPLTGTIPSEFGNLVNLRELMLSRLMLVGPIPSSIGKLTTLENLEIYGNLLSGSIPTEIGNTKNLKRMDAFNNKLRGNIPSTLANIENLQIIHLKKNRLTGTIPQSLGTLEYLTWFDASLNVLSGTIPSSLGLSRSLKDLRIGGNRIHDPIPQSLCKNPQINGGGTRKWGCDAILCSLGFKEESGFATSATGCKPCPRDETTMYLGATACIKLDTEDFLTIFFDVMHGENWESEEAAHWKDENVDVCSWKGIKCDSDGAITEISFPVSESDLG